MNNVAHVGREGPDLPLRSSRPAASVRRETVADGIVAAAREIAETTNIKAICCFSQTGTTVGLVARERPHVPIIALTPLMSTARRMCADLGHALRDHRAAGPLQGRRDLGACARRGTDGFATEERSDRA